MADKKGPTPRSPAHVSLVKSGEKMTRAAKFRVAAWFICLIGIISTGLAFRYEGEPDEMLEELNRPTKASVYQLERMGGKSEVLMAEFTNWWAAQWRAPNLPYSILISAFIGTGALLVIAKLDERASN